ncbi:hypothetical protein PMKS-001393 [Pichia membranifaciens]|uniref:N-terminal of MaoC-like dehydratase domain-containing protein n=1 Tax=Pichia membranifaciens TaxID=4926 RepID=A0A1Q2YEJ4_9ASCO|nr:hypothetical protein PMKS-001393 [Pichia membranifaciens]
MFGIRRFSKVIKAPSIPTEEEVSRIKSRLLKSSWRLTDDVISTYPAKQLYVTLESLLNKSKLPFMESLNIGNGAYHENFDLNRKFKIGDNLPVGYSLAYCNPLSNESELSSDGYDNYHAPTTNNKEFFKRRMWVSGSLNYVKSNSLKFGDAIHFTETVERVKFLPKNNLIFADYKRCFNNCQGNSLTEFRRLCYLDKTFEANERMDKTSSIVPDKRIVLNPSIITSFRMSALTFNSHQIHYNPQYAQNIENYTDVVLEAPLLVALVLQFWSDNNPDTIISSFKYKITSPCFINAPMTINYKLHNDHTQLWICNDKSTTCFESTIQV